MTAGGEHITEEGYEANCSPSSNPGMDVLVWAVDKYVKYAPY